MFDLLLELTQQQRQQKQAYLTRTRGDIGPEGLADAGYRGPGTYLYKYVDGVLKLKGPFASDREAHNASLFDNEFAFAKTQYIDHNDDSWYSTLAQPSSREAELARRAEQ